MQRIVRTMDDKRAQGTWG